MHSLRSARNFLTSHKEIIAESVVVILGVRHGIERPSRHGIPHQHVEVSPILFPDNGAEGSFCLSG